MTEPMLISAKSGAKSEILVATPFLQPMRERAVEVLSGEAESSEPAEVRRGWCMGGEGFRERMVERRHGVLDKPSREAARRNQGVIKSGSMKGVPKALRQASKRGRSAALGCAQMRAKPLRARQIPVRVVPPRWGSVCFLPVPRAALVPRLPWAGLFQAVGLRPCGPTLNHARAIPHPANALRPPPTI